MALPPFPSSNRSIGGYNCILKVALPNKFKCLFCKLLMRDPIQTVRGERSCESCYVYAKGNKAICPIDHEPITDGERFSDRSARREITQLECYCINKEHGCNWEGRVGDYQEHEPTCGRIPTSCPYSCGELVYVEELYDHLTKCATIDNGTACPFQEVGCRYQPKTSLDLSKHLQTDILPHSALTVASYNDVSKENEKIKKLLYEGKAQRVELTKKVEEVANQKKDIENKLKRIEDKFKEVQTQCASLVEQCNRSFKVVEGCDREMNVHGQDNTLSNMETKFTQLSLKYHEIEAKLNTLYSGTFPTNVSNNEEIKDKIGIIDQLESESALLSANLSDLGSKLRLLEDTCYEGKLIWKVDNIQYRMVQAVTGKVSVLHSSPCFQKRGGYKFCARLHLNGDGMGKGTHVSLFFVVMKSEYDSLLEWPFAERITFRLINPYDTEESIKESFIPDKNSSSFQKPIREMNIAAGCPMFIRKENLTKFILDDALYIETSIVST